jgi:hypothetical protein
MTGGFIFRQMTGLVLLSGPAGAGIVATGVFQALGVI